jgi:hypothetical protein
MVVVIKNTAVPVISAVKIITSRVDLKFMINSFSLNFSIKQALYACVVQLLLALSSRAGTLLSRSCGVVRL